MFQTQMRVESALLRGSAFPDAGPGGGGNQCASVRWQNTLHHGRGEAILDALRDLVPCAVGRVFLFKSNFQLILY